MITLREFAEELRVSANIVDIISASIPLKRAGANFKALCPFHQEKTPSFYVNPARQIFHCFGCDTGGDVIRFVKLFEKVSYREAVEILAKRLGKSLPVFKAQAFDSEKEQYRNVLLEIHQLAVEYFKKCLQDKRVGGAAREYLKKRGIQSEFIEKFSLGYAPEGEKPFLEFARARGYSEKALLDAGLIIRREGGGYFDRFYRRVIFPICDHLSRCIAFGGRGVSEETQPKYLNSPETEIYHKGAVLYALDLAKQEISRRREAIICEGYFDALQMHQFGFTNSVATLGTALTQQQAQLLRHSCERVLFLYDGDEAGEKAMLRGAEVLFRNGFQIKVVLLPDGNDPDSFLRTKGVDALQLLLEREAVDLIEFFLRAVRQRYDLEKPEGKIVALDLFSPLIMGLKNNDIMYDSYSRLLSETLKLDQNLIKKYFEKRTKEGDRISFKSYSANGQRSIIEAPELQKKMTEMDLLSLLLNFPKLLQDFKALIDCCWITDEKIRYWVERLFDAEMTEEISLPQLLESCEDEARACVLRQAALWRFLADNYEAYLESIPQILRLRYERLKRRRIIAEIKTYYELNKEYHATRPLLEGAHQISKTITQINIKSK